MKKSIRFLCLVLALAMCVTSFTGCKKKQELDLRDQIVTTTSTTVSGGDVSMVEGGGGTKVTTTTKSEDVWVGIDNWEGSIIDDETVLKYDFGGKTIIIDGPPTPDATKSKAEAAHR